MYDKEFLENSKEKTTSEKVQYGRMYKEEVISRNANGNHNFTEKRRRVENLLEDKKEREADPLFELMDF